MLIKGQDIANIIFGNTLSNDGLLGKAAGSTHRTFIYVNNRLEGNALETIAAMVET
jgi:hypothetical protein